MLAARGFEGKRPGIRGFECCRRPAPAESLLDRRPSRRPDPPCGRRIGDEPPDRPRQRNRIALRHDEPVTPSVTTDWMPPAAVVTTGVPDASASIRTLGNPSTFPLSSRTAGTQTTSAAASSAPTSSAGDFRGSARARDARLSRTLPQLAGPDCRRPRSPARRQAGGPRAWIRYSNPFLRTSLPAANTRGYSSPIASSARQWWDQRVRPESFHVDSVRHRLDPVRRCAECDRASCEVVAARGDAAGATKHLPAAALAAPTLSATKTSDPCRLMTSGSGGAAAAVAPPGTTQCPCMIVARRFAPLAWPCHPGGERQRRRRTPLPRSLTSACIPCAYRRRSAQAPARTKKCK